MSDRKKILSLFALHLSLTSFAWEVSGERVSPASDPFNAISGIQTSLQETQTHIQSNGTVLLSGIQAKELSKEAQAEVAEQAANIPIEPGMVTFVQRGPAITEVGPSQRIGEVAPENYPVLSAVTDGVAALEETGIKANPFDGMKNMRVGNVGQVFGTVKGLPLPVATVTGSKEVANRGVQVDPDQAGTALGANSDSTFGKMSSDKALANLIKKGASDKESLESQLAKDLENLKEKDKKKKDEKKNKKSPEELKKAVDDIKSLEPEFDFKAYENVRDLLFENPGIEVGGDPAFNEKAEAIFEAQSQRDRDEENTSKKANYQKFVDESTKLREEAPLFPARPQEPQRNRSDTHKN